jgi:hypothetical protein
MNALGLNYSFLSLNLKNCDINTLNVTLLIEGYSKISIFIDY